MSARVGIVLAVLLAIFVASPAAAHEFRPAVLRLVERGDAPGRFDLRLVAPKLGTAGPIAPGELTPIVPEHCELAPRSELAFTLDCGARGLVGPLGVDGLDRHPVDVMLDVRYADATRITAVLGPDVPTLTLGAAARERGSVFGDYLALGVEHILIGLDHLLFVLGLVLLVRARGAPTSRLLWTVTAFTLAHSITLALSTLELVALPSAPVEAGIALSILLLARELALGADDVEQKDTLTWRYPWLVAFVFGLLHGFGFAGALREIGLPADQAPLALLAFNVGVEAGQLAVVAVLLLGFVGLRRLAARLALRPTTEAIVRKLPVLAMGGLAFAWTLERVLGFWG